MNRRGGTEKQKGQPDELAFLMSRFPCEFLTPTASEQKAYRRRCFATSDMFPLLSFVDVAACLMEWMSGGEFPSLRVGPIVWRRVEGVTLTIRIGEM